MDAVTAGLRAALGVLLIAAGGLLQRRSFQRRRRIARRDLPNEWQLFAWNNIDVGRDFWIGLVLLIAGLMLLPV